MRLLVLALIAFTASFAQAETPQLIHLGTVAPDVVCLTISNGQYVEYGEQIPYTKQEGDKINDKDIHRWVYRKGKSIGTLVGADGKILHTVDSIVGEPFNISPAEKTSNWLITSPDDPNYSDEGKKPKSVHRKSRPTDMIRTGSWKFDAPVEHTLYIKLPYPLQYGKSYSLSLKPMQSIHLELTWEPIKQRSEAIHVSHLGFRPDDPAKVAFLSCGWAMVEG